MMAEETEKRDMSVREAGRRGGCKVRDEGLVDYQEMGKLGGATTKERYGVEHYSSIGRLGGQATAERHGSDFYERIGKAGGARVKALIAAAKAAEAGGEE